MSNGTPREVLKKYEGYGLIGGFAGGSLLGVMVSGPHFQEWPVWQSLSIIVGGAGLGSFIGYLALAIAIGSLGGGSVGSGGFGSGESGHSSESGGSAGGNGGGSDG